MMSPAPIVRTNPREHLQPNFPDEAMDLVSRLKDPTLFRQQAYVDGAWVGADGGGTVGVDDPATGQRVGTVPDMGAAETRRAIEAANRAWPEWRAKTGKERSAILRRWFDLMMANQDDLGAFMTAEQGKPLAEAKGEIAYGASFVEWFAEEAKRVRSEEHTSELQSLMRISYAVYGLKKKTRKQTTT